MKTTNASQFPYLNLFLNSVDFTTKIFGLNVSPIVKLETIQNLDRDTLGRSLADFLAQNKLKPFTTGIRRKQLHDCIHVLTGYDTSPIGEAEVQAFLLGCKFNLANFLLLAAIKRKMKRAIATNSFDYNLVRQRLLLAYKRGQNSHLDPDNWQPELLWNESLAKVRKYFAID